jgi:hypothetical protein
MHFLVGALVDVGFLHHGLDVSFELRYLGREDVLDLLVEFGYPKVTALEV